MLKERKEGKQNQRYGGPGGRATKHCTTSGFLIEQYSDGPIPCSNNGAAVRFCDRSHSAIKRSSTSATALTSIDLFLGSNKEQRSIFEIEQRTVSPTDQPNVLWDI